MLIQIYAKTKYGKVKNCAKITKKKKKNSGQEGIPPAQIISFLACLAQIL